MEGPNDNNPPMPQPEPTGRPAPEFITTNTAHNHSDEPPPYGLTDLHPEYKVAFENRDPPQPQPYPDMANQPVAIAYPPHSSNYYPTNVTSYPPTANTVVVHATGYPDTPVTAQCTICFQVVTTRVEYVSGSYTWMMCCLICIFCPLFCWLLPFFMLGMKDVYHYCPRCNHLMGTFSRA